MKQALSSLFLFLPALLHAQGYTPEEAVKRMQVPDGFTVKLVACEPMIRQPLSVSFDERGRMWVLQYLQYPNPAGLKPVKQDQYLRTVWDRVPEPPPQGPKGLDRITICYDPDANGRYQKSKDFVTGLNLASGFCIGHGGVFVLQSPYLLFYPDRDRDDVPDGDPEVLLKGFGFDDTHSVANSLQWGPDGWLYGAAGSTSTSKIDDPSGKCKTPIEFQQGIWRYHPKTKQFELFSEGGGNTFGLDFEKHGQAIAGTNWGGKAMLHQMQGAYYVKGFSKHGPLHNPHAYGYFDHVPYENFKGGHVTCGGIVYQADAYPPEYRDQYIAGNLLSSALYWHKLTPQGSSFTAKHGGDFLVANDSWFRPVDCFQGPDGSVYIADWYDKRAAHLDPIDNWDKTNGRIYKVEYKGTKPVPAMDLAKKTSAELVELLKHPNKWWRNEARRQLQHGNVDQVAFNALREMFEKEDGLPALEALWALAGSNNLSEPLVVKGLNHTNPHIRAWTVRFLGDGGTITTEQRELLVRLARTDTSPVVRAQLACTAKRLPAADAIPVLYELALGDTKDAQVPLLVWWAIEHHSVANGPALIDWLAHRGDAPMMHEVILERLARRFMAEGTPACYGNAAALYRMVLDDAHALIVLRGLNQALQGKRPEQAPDVLMKSLRDRSLDPEKYPEYRQVLLRLGDAPTYQTVFKAASDGSFPDVQRLTNFALLAELRKPDALPLFLDVFQHGKSEALRLGALSALQAYPDAKVGETVLTLFPTLTGNMRQKAQAMLLARKETALALLQLVEKGTINAKDLSVDQVRPVLAFDDPQIGKIVVKHWGKIGEATAGEKQARIAWLRVELGRGPGDVANGKALFTKNCATCHAMFGEGGKIGPDLTTADRKNRDYLLTHIVDPSLYVRPEFISYNVATLDGRKLTGLMSAAESNEVTVTLVNVIDNKPVKTSVARADIDEMRPSATSLMPDKLLDTLQYQEVRNLFAFLASEPPAKTKDGKKLKVLLISGSLEYKSDESLAAFQKFLEANYPVECSRAFRKADDDLPGLEGLETCDVALFFTRRLTIKGEQLERVKKYALAGKPIVAIRTASHGFQNWLAMDKEVFGGDYKNHYGAGPKCEVSLTAAGKRHPILKGFKPYASSASLYKNPDVAKDVTVLLTGSIPEHTEPVAWVRDFKGGRVFYTSLGHPDDFKDEGFLKMVANALFWTAKREP
jgi:putative membrane-bound dehydrogenase-like protein